MRALSADFLHRRGKSTRSPAPPLRQQRPMARPGWAEAGQPLLVLPSQRLGWVRSPLLSPSSPPHVTSSPLSSSVTPGAAARAANPPPLASHWLVRSRASGIAAAHAGRAVPPSSFLPEPARGEAGGGSTASEARTSRRPLPPPRACSSGGPQPRPRTRTGPPHAARPRGASRSVSRAAVTAVAAFRWGARALRPPPRPFPAPGRDGGRDPSGGCTRPRLSPYAAPAVPPAARSQGPLSCNGPGATHAQ